MRRRYRVADEVEQQPRARSARAAAQVPRARTAHGTMRTKSDCTPKLDAQVEQAVAEYLATAAPAPESMFEHLFAQLPSALAARAARRARAEARRMQ